MPSTSKSGEVAGYNRVYDYLPELVYNSKGVLQTPCVFLSSIIHLYDEDGVYSQSSASRGDLVRIPDGPSFYFVVGLQLTETEVPDAQWSEAEVFEDLPLEFKVFVRSEDDPIVLAWNDEHGLHMRVSVNQTAHSCSLVFQCSLAARA